MAKKLWTKKIFLDIIYFLFDNRARFKKNSLGELNLLASVRGFFGNLFGKENYDEDDDYVENKSETRKNSLGLAESYNSKIVDITKSSVAKQIEQVVVIYYPKNINDAALAGDGLKEKKILIVNLENVNKEDAQRIADFLSGAAYNANGSIEKISSDIFVVAPENISISGEFKEELFKKGLILPWVSSN